MKTEKIMFDKKRLFEDLERLPKSDVKEILDFAEFILSKRLKGRKVLKNKLDPQNDPILKFMGMADVELLPTGLTLNSMDNERGNLY